MKAAAWTPEEDAVLIAGVRKSAPNKVIARELGRSLDAVETRISVLRHAQKLPPAVIGRRFKHPAAPSATVTPGDLWARADLAQAVTTLGRLLPDGMRVLIYRPDGEARAAIETTCSDGETTRHWVDQAMH